MEIEYGSTSNVRFLVSSQKSEPHEEWIYVLDDLPKDGEKVICHGNKAMCCELDMEEASEHIAIYHRKEDSWKEDEKGNKYDITYYHDFDIDDEPYHLIFVSRWKKIIETGK